MGVLRDFRIVNSQNRLIYSAVACERCYCQWTVLPHDHRYLGRFGIIYLDVLLIEVGSNAFMYTGSPQIPTRQ
jgi:hypothetical protein